MGEPKSLWQRAPIGCSVLAVAAALGLALLLGLGTTLWLQVRSDQERATTRTEVVPDLPGSAAPQDGAGVEGSPLAVRLNVSVVEMAVVRARPGEPLAIEADFDDSRYELVERAEGNDRQGWTYDLQLRPRGSATLALLRVKLGARPPQLRVRLPAGVPLELSGTLDRAFGALELGGLTLDDADLRVHAGGVVMSFFEPLSRPMERLEIRGDTGSLKVVGLGNASPSAVVLEQRVGEIDLDFRGGWVRDAEVSVAGRLAGGTIWLPDNVTVEGLGDAGPSHHREPRERELPVLRLDVSSTVGRLLFVD